MRVEYNVWNQSIGRIRHLMYREELRDNGLASLARRHLIALFQVSNGSKLDSNSNDILLVLDNVDVLNTSGFIVFIQERGVVLWFILSLRLLLGH